MPARDRPTVFGLLHKFALAWNRLGLDAGFLAFVLGRGPGIGWTDIAAFPMTRQAVADLDSWSRLADAAALQAGTFTVERSLFALLESAAQAQADTSSFVVAEFLSLLSDWSGWPAADLLYLTGSAGFNMALPADMQDERALVRLRDVFDLVRRTGAGAEQAHAWTIAELGFAETQAIRQTLSLAYAPDAWLGVLGSIQDDLRTRRRDALLGHLVNHLGMDDADAFYRHYLIDPGYAPCALTSRIVEAHAAVQLFAQRILLNLERFSFERADAEAWEWRKKYRVWEAARRIFLQPENWLEPEWRDNKSAFFEDLEAGLLQDDVTQASAERLYLEFLHKVDDVSRLEIAGTYLDEDAETETETLHMFGRTHDAPHRYFYRRWEDGAVWTPWEPVDLDIAGNHLVPVVNNGRLFLLWPEFSISDNPNATTVTTTLEMSDPERADELRDEIADHQDRIDDIDAQLSSPLMDSPNYKGPSADELGTERAGHAAAIADLADELDALTVERSHVVQGNRYLIELGMNWSVYREGRWTGKQASSDTISYTTSDPLARHYFTGWTADDGVLRVSARIDKRGNGEGIAEVRSPEGYVGYFYFEQCGGHLLGTSVDVADPTGEVLVTGSFPRFQSAYWVNASWSNESLELEIDGAADTRVLLTATGTLMYAHQYGGHGTERSPFVFTDGSRTYFVEPLPDVLVWPDVWSFPLADALVTVPSERPVRRLGAAPTRAGSQATESLALEHYSSADVDAIVDRDVTSLSSGTLQGTIGNILQHDTSMTAVAGAAATQTAFRYRFTRLHHPYTCLFLKQQYRFGVGGLLAPDPSWGGDSAELYRQLLPSGAPSFSETFAPNRDWVYDNFGADVLEEQIRLRARVAVRIGTTGSSSSTHPCSSRRA